MMKRMLTIRRIYRLSWLHKIAIILLLVIQIKNITPIVVVAWEWSDLVLTTTTWQTAITPTSWWNNNMQNTVGGMPSASLSIQEISDMRVRDIKRRLSRTHGYSAEELNKVLDKKELIQALAFEEEKVRLSFENTSKRIVMQQTIIIAIITTLLILCWPLLSHAYEVIMINIVVYTDRKKVEAIRCYDLQSHLGFLGVLCMSILDLLQVWLTVSVLLSWVTTSRKYSFPIPQLTIRPGQLMGGDVANSSVGNYGINVGSMLVTYGLRFMYGKVEYWTGIVLAKKAKQQRHDARQNESIDERTARRAARKAMKEEALYRQQQHSFASTMHYNSQPQPQPPPPPPPPPEWLAATSRSSTINSNISAKIANGRQSHQEFLQELYAQQETVNSDSNNYDDENDNIFESIMDRDNNGELQSPMNTMDDLD